MYPSLLTRISYQVGSPWMLDGKTFFPEIGIPMRKIACISSAFALAEPVPFTVPILKAKSLMPGMRRSGMGDGGWGKCRPGRPVILSAAKDPLSPGSGSALGQWVLPPRSARGHDDNA